MLYNKIYQILETLVGVYWNRTILSFFLSLISLFPALFRFNSLQWRNNGRDSVSNHQTRECLLNHLIRCRSKKTSKLRVTGLCAGNSPETGESPAQRASNGESVSIWWRHHVKQHLGYSVVCIFALTQIQEWQQSHPFKFRFASKFWMQHIFVITFIAAIYQPV